jgi:hypothetical protein
VITKKEKAWLMAGNGTGVRSCGALPLWPVPRRIVGNMSVGTAKFMIVEAGGE